MAKVSRTHFLMKLNTFYFSKLQTSKNVEMEKDFHLLPKFFFLTLKLNPKPPSFLEMVSVFKYLNLKLMLGDVQATAHRGLQPGEGVPAGPVHHHGRGNQAHTPPTISVHWCTVLLVEALTLISLLN